jgi:hypothetical protein
MVVSWMLFYFLYFFSYFLSICRRCYDIIYGAHASHRAIESVMRESGGKGRQGKLVVCR